MREIRHGAIIQGAVIRNQNPLKTATSRQRKSAAKRKGISLPLKANLRGRPPVTSIGSEEIEWNGKKHPASTTAEVGTISVGVATAYRQMRRPNAS